LTGGEDARDPPVVVAAECDGSATVGGWKENGDSYEGPVGDVGSASYPYDDDDVVVVVVDADVPNCPYPETDSSARETNPDPAKADFDAKYDAGAVPGRFAVDGRRKASAPGMGSMCCVAAAEGIDPDDEVGSAAAETTAERGGNVRAIESADPPPAVGGRLWLDPGLLSRARSEMKLNELEKPRKDCD